MDTISLNQAAFRQRLLALEPSILNICKFSGTPGISIGVIHQDQVVYSFNEGYSQAQSGARVDQETVFHIASMIKVFTGVALGILVEEGLLHW
jgi:CubicO group peptidase (beta-lactamase class C family)